MGQVHQTRGPQRSRAVRPRRGAGIRLAFIAFLGVAGFAAGFILLWALGSVMVGGAGFPWESEGDSASVPAAMPVDTEYTVEPLVDLIALRDLSYVPVKGVYMTGYAAGDSGYVNQILALADETEINAIVMNVKEDDGYLTYDADVPMARELGLIDKRIGDIDGLIATLSEHDIMPIARVVCFKDPRLATKRPELAVQSTEGGMWADWKDQHYTNPYNHEVWEYLVQVAEDAARHGFREIQFDYVRFPTDGPISKALYPGEYCKMEDAIAGFLAYARGRLEKLGVWVSADVFGLTVHTTGDGGFGQQIEKICQNVDIVCPMVYPSHYSDGSYGYAEPNREPYGIVSEAMKDTRRRLAGTGALGRPWLQDFSLGGVEYGVERVKAQIKAAEEQGFTEWLLWDPSLKYTVGALRPEGA